MPHAHRLLTAALWLLPLHDGALLTCPAGSYAADAVTCALCPIGRYLSAPSTLSACVGCAVATYTTALGATACFACNVPGVVLVSGITCQGCATGQYCLNGVSANCSAGTFSSALAASTCSSCTLGTYTAYTSSSSCAACTTGMYSTLLAASACAACAVGKYASGIGSLACSDCPIGSVALTQGADACHYPLGLYPAVC